MTSLERLIKMQEERIGNLESTCVKLLNEIEDLKDWKKEVELQKEKDVDLRDVACNLGEITGTAISPHGDILLGNTPFFEFDLESKGVGGSDLINKNYSNNKYVNRHMHDPIRTRGNRLYLTRYQIAEMAEGDWKTMKKSFDKFNEFQRVSFKVDAKKKTVVALKEELYTSFFTKDFWKVIEREVSKCHPLDIFNPNVGKAIAIRRLLGKDIPDHYINMPDRGERYYVK